MKINLKRAMGVAFLFFFTFACCNKSNLINGPVGAHYRRSPVSNSSVYFIIKSDFVEDVTRIDESSESEPKLMLLQQSTGTGTSISSNKKYSNIITAGHVCVNYFDIVVSEVQYQVYDYKGNVTNADLIAFDRESDLCLLRIYRPSKPVKISKKNSKSGDMVYYGGYPLGIYSPESLHHFSGYFSGSDSNGWSIFTFAAAPGASGSAIVDEYGSLIGVISAVTERFDYMVLGPNLERINAFILLSENCEKFCVETK